jgi:hypothetical protein
MKSFVFLLAVISLIVSSSARDVMKDLLGGSSSSSGGSSSVSADKISAWLSAAAYCEASTYMSRVFYGPSTGFVVTNVIDNQPEDIQVSQLLFFLFYVSNLLFSASAGWSSFSFLVY